MLKIFAPLQFQRFSPSYPLQRHPNWRAVALQEQSAELRHFSAISRASRHTKMSIQRFLGSFPPVISADKLQFVHSGLHPHPQPILFRA